MATSDFPPQADTQYVLPDTLYTQLWQYINSRLLKGETLITPSHFRRALVEDYRTLFGTTPSLEMQKSFIQAISTFNKKNPHVYVAQGIHNCVSKAFLVGVSQLAWDSTKIKTYGEQAINRFTTSNRIQDFLQTVHFNSNQINSKTILQAVAVSQQKVSTSAAADNLIEQAPLPLNEETVKAIRDGNIDHFDVDTRLLEQEKERRNIEQNEIQRVPSRVQIFMDQGMISNEESQLITQLYEIDQLVTHKKIDISEGNRQRRTLMNSTTRTALDKKLREVVGYSVRYLQVFEALKRITPKYDAVLRFLIRHKAIVETRDDKHSIIAAIKELLNDKETLQKTIALMSRQDHEIRMMAVSLPPYNQIIQAGKERIKNFIITEDFIDDLRHINAAEMSKRLNSSDNRERTHAAASIRCFIAIIDHLLKPTVWRKELRLLKIQIMLEEFYQTSDSPASARIESQDFIKKRVRKMFGDLSPDERLTIKGRSAAMIQAAEDKTDKQRPEQSVPDSDSKAPSAKPPVKDELALSKDEIRQGAQVGRVEMRLPNGHRTVRRRIIPDPDDRKYFVIAQRVAETGELIPLLRNGAKRRVSKDRDSLWHVSI